LLLNENYYVKKKNNDDDFICIAVDLKEMAPIQGANIIVGDITAKDTVAQVLSMLGPGNYADLVLFDGAPDIYGLSDIDDWLQCRLVYAALDMARQILANQACFIAKIYRERSANDLIHFLSQFFASIIIAKPRSSRAASVEAFIVCRGFLGNNSFNHHPTNSFPPHFIACGEKKNARASGDNHIKLLDADASYPLELFPDYKFRRPVMGPIKPVHLAATTAAFRYDAGYQRYASSDEDHDQQHNNDHSLVDKRHQDQLRLALPANFRPFSSIVLMSDTLPPPATDTASLQFWLLRSQK